MSALKIVWSFARNVNKITFKRHPLLTNVTLSCCVAATSDYIAQKFIQGHETLDTQRTRHMVTYGFTTAPLWHLWYNMVDKYVKQSKVWLKVLLDQTTVTPLDYIGFFAVFNYVKGDSIEECISELKRVYFKALIPDTMFWPSVAFIGYKWIPLQYRFVYFEFLGLVWDTFLSCLKYSDKDQFTNTGMAILQRDFFSRNKIELDSKYIKNYKTSQMTKRCNEMTLTNYAIFQNFGESDLPYFSNHGTE